MRLLPEDQRREVLREVCDYARETTRFQLPDCDLHIQVIPGETEGLYGWIAANYLLGGFDNPDEHAHGKGHHTYGFLDMGGASAQIAFAPNATEAEKHSNDLVLLRLRNIDGAAREYRVFVTTWLGFGANEARRRYVEALQDSVEDDAAHELPDPCLPAGLTVTKSGQVIKAGSPEAKGKESYLLGTGQFTECLSQTFPLLDKTAACDDPPCLLHGVHVPAIDFDVNHFVGVSEYWHTTHEIFEMDSTDKAYDVVTYQQRVSDFCSQDWSSIQNGITGHKWGKKVDETTAVQVCFKASWIINMLHDGIGIPRVGLEDTSGLASNGTKEVLDKAGKVSYLAPFQAVNKIDSTEVSWTLGKMVLYAASQISPLDSSTLAVGFGANVAGTPPKFQYAGSSSDTKYGYNTDHDDDDDGNDTDDDDDWEDRLLKNPNLRRRAPGLLLFLLIVIVITLLLLGRDRRNALLRKLTPSFLHRSSPSSSPSGPRRRRNRNLKLPFNIPGLSLSSSGAADQKYDRVLEEGGEGSADYSPSDFELSRMSSASDSDDGASRRSTGSAGSTRRRDGAGLASGTVTPNVRRMGGGGGGYFDGQTTAQGVGLGLGLSGLTSRNESRERLTRVDSRDRLDPGSAAGGLGGVGRGSSRAGSPTRWRSPMMSPVKESVD